MNRLIDLKILLLLLVLVSCQKLKPESVAIPEYPDFKSLMDDQVERLGKGRIKKEVWLDGKSEVRIIEMDSTKWAEELSFLKEINPNQPEYVGAFEKSADDQNQVLTLSPNEKGAIKKISFSKSDDEYQRITASFHEDKDVYIHHRDIEMTFEDGILNFLKIDGYQKMMFKDTVRFRVKVEVY
ncbi:hypothetical protein [Ekhidna sp.]|uniref:hypothetical protein n=1 Tax=Ekhidna sp. TaxID=2608089 RepID=UPI0035183829